MHSMACLEYTIAIPFTKKEPPSDGPRYSLHSYLYRLTRLLIIAIRRACYHELINAFRSFLCESDLVLFDLHILLILRFSVLRLHRQLRARV